MLWHTCTLKHARPEQGRAEAETTIVRPALQRQWLNWEVGSPGGFRLNYLTWLELSVINQNAELTLDWTSVKGFWFFDSYRLFFYVF